ncbi:hypothetical protein BJS_09087 [Bradyrhizobium japonicum SEMIA 5079]|nr:hypothetical protein BJS_09087 [Bradyrhizobium japonicum SEMIA 5079]
MLLHRRHYRAQDRPLAGRRHLQRDPRQPVARHRCRPQHPRLQVDRLRDRRGLCGLRRRPARRIAGLHAARRLHLRHLGPARDADRHRRQGYVVRTAGRRGGLALPSGLSSSGAGPRRGLETRARRRVRGAGLLPARRHRRRSCGPLSPRRRQTGAERGGYGTAVR